ncbi:MAG: FtsX-like permease family protein [Roseiflexaceae bacterium]|nr:FtsX-like permease family protein [Roseiflexaceae bacterium]
MLKLPQAIVAILVTALKRLRANWSLTLCALIALTAATALAMSVPMYAEASNLRLLKDEIAKQEARNNRSAFALLFQYVGSWNGALEWDKVKPADEYISGRGLANLRLPLDGLGRYVTTDLLKLYLPPSAATENQFLRDVKLGFLSGMEAQIQLVDGAKPKPASGTDAPIEVMIARDMADQMGLNVGDKFSIITTAGSKTVSLPISISGIWQAANPADPAWFYPPSAFLDTLLVAEETYAGPIAGTLQKEVGLVIWFARMNGSGLTAENAGPLLARVERVRARASGAVPGLKLVQSPAEALGRYTTGVTSLTNQLLVFSVPILGLVLYFAALVASLLLGRQRAEIALLKTRGVRDLQILGISVVEWLLIGGLALALGAPLALMFAQFMGRTTSFLQLSNEAAPLILAIGQNAWMYGLVAVGLAMLAALVPASLATRRTLVDEQQQAARVAKPPLWQRAFLDVLLLIPPLYGIYQLQRTGGLQLGGAAGSDPFSNPLLVLVPVLLCFALGLIAVRIIPWIFALLARLARGPRWVGPLVAFQALARQPGNYRGPLLLLVLTLSLATFSASMAATLDGAMQAALAYRIGAQTQLIETGESTEQSQPGQPGQPGGGGGTPDRANIEEEPRFLFVPVSEHLLVDGIEAAARVGSYSESTASLGGANKQIQLVGIDRIDFPKVVNFQKQWGGNQSLGTLMNLLARNTEGVLVSRDVLASGFNIGDTLPAQVRIAGDQREVKFRIVGAVDLWPGFYPQDGPIVVANLDYIFDSMGGQYPYDVWIARAPDADVTELIGGVRGLGITVVDALDAQELIAAEQAKPQRQGLFGLLSVGFITAGGLTLLGFLLAALITARRRSIELGVLRALGLGGGQVALALILEQVTLVVAGLAAGTGIGLAVSSYVVPLLQIGLPPHPGVPGYAPQIAWDQVTIIYAIFGVALLLTLLALAWTLGRMKLFQAIKLGDAN